MKVRPPKKRKERRGIAFVGVARKSLFSPKTAAAAAAAITLKFGKRATKTKNRKVQQISWKIRTKLALADS